MNNSLTFSTFTILYTHHFYLVPNMFLIPKKIHYWQGNLKTIGKDDRISCLIYQWKGTKALRTFWTSPNELQKQSTYCLFSGWIEAILC